MDEIFFLILQKEILLSAFFCLRVCVCVCVCVFQWWEQQKLKIPEKAGVQGGHLGPFVGPDKVIQSFF